jgi:phosphoribosylaminoimidazole-succinocarboxamide synthase
MRLLSFLSFPFICFDSFIAIYDLSARCCSINAKTFTQSIYTNHQPQGIPAKGALLTQLSAHWFNLIATWMPSLKTHFLSADLPSNIPSEARSQLDKRSMQVRRYQIVPLESIVRGYITGSAWSEYKKHGTVHGMPMPEGLQESQKLEKPIWTPSTKAEQGDHDENISRDKAVEIVGESVAKRVEEASLLIYEKVCTDFFFVSGCKPSKLTNSIQAREYAEERGIIIADTKFEFGLDEAGEIVLVDEVLTPDSSRFWPADKYAIGRGQSSYDKQFLRDWLTDSGLKGKEGVGMPEEVAAETASKYREAFTKITGQSGL